MENNTPASPAATLSEKELFAEFLHMNVVEHASMFGEFSTTYKPDDWLRDPGLEYQMEEFANDLADRLAESESPLERLDAMVQDIENYARLLRRVSDDFRWMTLHRLAETDDEEERFERLPIQTTSGNVLDVGDSSLAGGRTLDEIAADPTPEDALALRSINHDLSGQSQAMKVIARKPKQRRMALNEISDHLRKNLSEDI